MKHCAGKNIIANDFPYPVQLRNIQKNEVPIEASNLISVVQRYHQRIRRG